MIIVFPNSNEKKFLEKKEDVRFIYPFKKGFSSDHEFGFLTTKKIQGFSVHKSIGNDRPVFERGVSLIYDLEQDGRQDFIFQRNAGMNHVLARLAHRKHMAVGFNFNSFLKAKNKPVLLGRMQQNMRLCEKYGVDYEVASFARNPSEVIENTYLKSFERILKKKRLF